MPEFLDDMAFAALTQVTSILIITAMPDENDIAEKYIPTKIGYKYIAQKGIYRFGMLGKYLVAHADFGQGSIAANHSVTMALHEFRRNESESKPIVVISIGLAAGLKRSEEDFSGTDPSLTPEATSAASKQIMCDILVASKIIPWTMRGKHSEDGNRVEREVPSIMDAATIAQFRTLKTSWNYEFTDNKGENRRPSIHIGPIVCGPDVIDNAEKRQEIISEHKDAIGYEMEGFGATYAVVQSHMRSDHRACWFFLIKSICDWGVGREAAGFGDTYHQNAIVCAFEFLKHCMDCETLFPMLKEEVKKK